MVLANKIEYKKASCTVVIARHKMRLRLDQYPFRSLWIFFKALCGALRLVVGCLHEYVVKRMMRTVEIDFDRQLRRPVPALLFWVLSEHGVLGGAA